MRDLFKYTKELNKLFTSSENILLVCHLNPDGDAIGSQLALYHYLISIGKRVEMISPNYLQEFLKWMTGADLINIFTRKKVKCKKLIENADLIVMLDFNQLERSGEAEQIITSSRAKKVVIDHHIDPQDFADLIISDTSKCATSELVYEIVTSVHNGPFISKPYAEALYVGIITDTGNFEHGSYTGDTLRIIAGLLETGIEKEKILDLIYNSFSIDRMRLLGYALNKKMVILPRFKTAYICLTKDDLASFNFVKGDTEGFVNIPLSISGIIFSALLIEKDGFIKLSFRSKGQFNVNEFARKYFSGGGHMNASGAEYPDTLENTVRYFVGILEKDFDRFNKKD